MKHIELLNSFRREIAELKTEVESAVAMGHLDINKICEDVFCGVLKVLYQFENLRNLNADEKKDYPGIDLADDSARVAIQVTSDKSLDKVKDTIQSIKSHKLYEKYDRFIVYVITSKQNSYSQDSIDKVCGEYLSFDARKDILDYRDISTRAANADPQHLKTALDHLVSYRRGAAVGLAAEDFDPPGAPPESIGTNLVEIFFPGDLFIAEIVPDALTTPKGKRVKNHRKGAREYAADFQQTLPSDFVALGGRLITFHDLEESGHPFKNTIEDGTVERFAPDDFFKIDDDHERVFKSLLRFVLQQKLYRHRVLWQHLEGKFIFLPVRDAGNKRSESWTDRITSSRMVFERKFNRNKPDKVLSTRHFAFSAEFLRIEDRWFVALTPDWFFSYGDEYRRSHFGDKLLSGLKRMEKNRSVYDQVRFLASWLEAIDRDDLFSANEGSAPTMSFGELLTVDGGRHLNEALWARLEAPDLDAAQERLGVD